jgi:DNA replication and repair protein RecF
VYLAHLSLVDFRSYPTVELPLSPGVSVFVGPNGHGKTNLVEAVGYLATLGSHRVATDAPLVRDGADHAVVRGLVDRDGHRTLLEVDIQPGRANQARINRSPLPRARELLGLLRAVTFAPEDLALVRGDPGERRRYLDELAVSRRPALAGVRADYERILKQRNALLKSASAARRGADLGTLDVWDAHLARAGAALLAARLELVELLAPRVAAAYDEVAGLVDGRGADLAYRSSLGPGVGEPGGPRQPAELARALTEAMAGLRRDELDRGVCLVGPHRDDLLLSLHGRPARGYASHGESWSLALALRVAAFEILTEDTGGPVGREITGPPGPSAATPVLILDDVFAELDRRRREGIVTVARRAEQVLVTAAVAEDVPPVLAGSLMSVHPGTVERVA